MSDDFWQTIRPVSVQASRWSTIVLAEGLQKFRVAYRIPAFSISPVLWIGASFIVYELRFTTTKKFSFRLPITPQASFVLAVRWVEGDTVHRYKFWEGIGEILHYPLYTGQPIDSAFVLEIWSVEDQNTISLATPLVLSTGILINRTSCCEYKPADLPLQLWPYLFDNLEGSYNGSPSTNLPLIFDQPLNTDVVMPGEGIQTEDSNFILTEDGMILMEG